MLLGLFKKEFHQLFPSGFLGHTADFLGKDQILSRNSPQEILYQRAVEMAGIGAACQHPLAVQQKHRSVFQGNDTHRQHLHPGTGECLSKQTARGNHRQHTAVSVVIIPDNLNRAGQHHPHKFRPITFQEHRTSFGDVGGFSIQAA